MNTKQIVSEQMKEFDDEIYIPCESSCISQEYPTADCNCDTPKTRGEIKSFIFKDYTHKLTESVAEEIIGKDEVKQVRVKDDCYRSGYKTKSLGNAYMRNKLRAEQRLRVKEILSNLK